MSELTHDEMERRRKHAAEELTRIICELWVVSGKTQTQIANLMGYSSRRPIWDMCNYRYGQHLYPEWRLSSFLSAVGVRWPQDVAQVFRIYDSVAGRETTREQLVIRYDPVQRLWVRDDGGGPITEEVAVERDDRESFTRLIYSSS